MGRSGVGVVCVRNVGIVYATSARVAYTMGQGPDVGRVSG